MVAEGCRWAVPTWHAARFASTRMFENLEPLVKNL